MLPEVAIISTRFSTNQRLPKFVAIQQFVERRRFVLVTGVATGTVAKAQIAVSFQQHSRGRDPTAECG